MNHILVAQHQPVVSDISAAYDIVNDEWIYIKDNPFSLSDQIRFNSGGFKIKNREVLRRYGPVWSYYIRELSRTDDRLQHNRDPWNRQFKVYNNEGTLPMNAIYRCDAIRLINDKIISYVYVTTISGVAIYCVDNIV